VKTTRFVCLRCNTYVDPQAGKRAVRCPLGHLTRAISSTSVARTAIQRALLLALTATVIVLGYRFFFFDPLIGPHVLGSLAVGLPVLFTVVGIVMLFQGWRTNHAGTPAGEYARDRLGEGIGTVAGAFIIFALMVLIPALVRSR